MPTVSKQLDLLCWNNGLPFVVKCLINGYLQRGILQQAMMEITDPKMHRDIKRCIKQLKLYKQKNINYGRFMLHIIHPTFRSQFHKIDFSLSTRVVEIGGIRFNSIIYSSRIRRHTLEFGEHVTKKKLVEAIEINCGLEGSDMRLVEQEDGGLKGMSKKKLFKTLLMLPDFNLDPVNAVMPYPPFGCVPRSAELTDRGRASCSRASCRFCGRLKRWRSWNTPACWFCSAAEPYRLD